MLKNNISLSVKTQLLYFSFWHATFYIGVFQQFDNRTHIENFSSIVIRSSKINRENQIESTPPSVLRQQRSKTLANDSRERGKKRKNSFQRRDSCNLLAGVSFYVRAGPRASVSRVTECAMPPKEQSADLCSPRIKYSVLVSTYRDPINAECLCQCFLIPLPPPPQTFSFNRIRMINPLVDFGVRGIVSVVRHLFFFFFFRKQRRILYSFLMFFCRCFVFGWLIHLLYMRVC